MRCMHALFQYSCVVVLDSISFNEERGAVGDHPAGRKSERPTKPYTTVANLIHEDGS